MGTAVHLKAMDAWRYDKATNSARLGFGLGHLSTPQLSGLFCILSFAATASNAHMELCLVGQVDTTRGCRRNWLFRLQVHEILEASRSQGFGDGFTEPGNKKICVELAQLLAKRLYYLLCLVRSAGCK